MLHQQITETTEAEPGAATRLLLESQRERLIAAIYPESEPWAVARARRMITQINERLQRDNAVLHAYRGMYGENGWAPAIADMERSLRFRSTYLSGARA